MAPRHQPPEPTTPLAERNIDELMRLAGGLPDVRPTESEPTQIRLLRPTRESVATAFRGVTSEIRACAPTEDGVVSARVFLDGPTGRARSARVEGIDGAAANCMTRALMAVRVDPFLQERLAITFPYRL